MKKDNDRREGKGRRFCWGGRIYVIPCRSSCFAYRTIIKNRMNSSFFQIILEQFVLLFKIVLGKSASVARN